jgi:hypothetical protein
MNIVGIIDLDGFCIQKTFFCREIGLITHGDTYGTSFHFNTPLRYEELSIKDRFQVKYLQESIHGLSLGDNKAMDQAMVNVIVRRFYDAYRMDANSMIGLVGVLRTAYTTR